MKGYDIPENECMEKNQILEYISEVNKLLEDFFFKPLISTAMERFGIDNAREIRYFLRDAQVYVEDKSFMEEGVAELVSFCRQLANGMLPGVDEALLVSPFQYDKFSIMEDEYLYRKMMANVFKDNLDLLDSLVKKLQLVYPGGSRRHLAVPERDSLIIDKEMVRA